VRERVLKNCGANSVAATEPPGDLVSADTYTHDVQVVDAGPSRVQEPLKRNGRRGEVMIEAEHLESSLPELDHTNDPRGGAVVWALLAVSVAVVVGILLTVTWAPGSGSTPAAPSASSLSIPGPT
jgi:hypothetical protein